MGFDPGQFNLRHHRRMWRHLNGELAGVRRRAGMGMALQGLWVQQRLAGIVVSDPNAIQRWRLRDHESGQALIVQWNPERARRVLHATRAGPDAPEAFVHAGCAGCQENMYLRSGGRQLGLDVDLPSGPWILVANPFGLAPHHCVAFTRTHEPQTWVRNSPQETRQALRRLLEDLVTLASSLPGWIALVNGYNAGATVAEHRHVQGNR